MGYSYEGGGFVNGLPRRDLTDAEVQTLPAVLRSALERTTFYQPCADADVKLPRTDWRVVRETPLRVLLFCPTYRLEPETVSAIFAQDYGGALDFYFTRDNPYSQDVQHGYHNIWHNLTKAHAHFLNGNYDALFIVESDIIPPADVLRKLTELDADIAGGMYAMRHDAQAVNAFVYVPNQDSPGAPMWTSELTGVVRTNGVCMGCVLAHRHVVERVPFRMHDSAAPDWAWMTDCNAAGFVTVCDTSVFCGHKRTDGVVLWPTLV